MKKLLLVISTMFALSACSTGDMPMTNKRDVKTVCLDGVTYYLFRETVAYSGYGYMSPKFNRDGSVSLCEN